MNRARIRTACAVVLVLGASSGYAASPGKDFQRTVEGIASMPIADQLPAMTDAALHAIADTGWWSVALGSAGAERIRFGLLAPEEAEEAQRRAEAARHVTRDAIRVLRIAIESAQLAGVAQPTVDRAVVVSDEILPTVSADAASLLSLIGEQGSRNPFESVGSAVTQPGEVRLFVGRVSHDAWSASIERVLTAASAAQRAYETLDEDERAALGASGTALGRSVEFARAAAIARARSPQESITYLEQRGMTEGIAEFRVRAHVERLRQMRSDGASPDALSVELRALEQAVEDAVRVDAHSFLAVEQARSGRVIEWVLDRSGTDPETLKAPALRTALASAAISQRAHERARALIQGVATSRAAVIGRWLDLHKAWGENAADTLTRREALTVLTAVTDAIDEASQGDAADLLRTTTDLAEWHTFDAEQELEDSESSDSVLIEQAFSVASRLAQAAHQPVHARVWATRGIRTVLASGDVMMLSSGIDLIEGAPALEDEPRAVLVDAIADALTRALMDQCTTSRVQRASELVGRLQDARPQDIETAGEVPIARAAAAIATQQDSALRMVRTLGSYDTARALEVRAWGYTAIGETGSIELERMLNDASSDAQLVAVLRGAARGVHDVLIATNADASDLRGVVFDAAAMREAVEVLRVVGPRVCGTSLLTTEQALCVASTLVWSASDDTFTAIDRSRFAEAALQSVGGRLARGDDDPVSVARFTLLAAGAWHAQGELERAFASYRSLAGKADRDPALGGRDGAIAVRAWIGMLSVALDADESGTRRARIQRAFERLALRDGFAAFAADKSARALKRTFDEG